MSRWPLLLPLLLLTASCGRHAVVGGATTPGGPGARVEGVPAVPRTEPADPPCTELGCRLFDTPQQAFAEVLRSNPKILGVGEWHSLKRHKGLASPVARFTELLLPMLGGKASDLVLELWLGTGKCVQQQQEVEREQAPVREQQSEATPNEFVLLGKRARALRIFPHGLEPSCEDFERVLRAGDDSIQQMLELTARMFRDQATSWFNINMNQGVDGMVVTYSGAMHNDLHPDHACGDACAFGRQLSINTGGRYVEVDLVVPEYIHDGPVWSQRSWYRYFDRTRVHRKTTLFNPWPGSYVLIFPSTPDWKPPKEPAGRSGESSSSSAR
ncbi:MAG TPA: hypothetical protein PLI95_08665 [Polyangiaceae bacterium]|nr:hypothetical protein [Polyangiaceae bacterium]